MSIGILVVLAIGALTVGYLEDSVREDITQTELSTMFGEFKREFGKHYASQAEEVYRMNVFKDNVKVILSHNMK